MRKYTQVYKRNINVHVKKKYMFNVCADVYVCLYTTEECIFSHELFRFAYTFHLGGRRRKINPRENDICPR